MMHSPSHRPAHEPRRLLRALGLGVLLLLAPLAGQAAGCRPVPADKAVAAPGNFSRGLLWKIETEGAAPSYLFGTFHTSDPRITNLPCPVKEAFDRAASFTMEMITNGGGIVSMAEAMFFNDGRTLRGVLGEPLYRQTVQAMSAGGARRTNGIDHMKPWAVMMAFGASTPRRGLFLDMALQLDATLQGKPTYGVETMQEQIAVFNGMSIEDQVVLLRDALNTRGLAACAMEELTQAYLKRDLRALMALSDKYKTPDARVHDVMMDRLLTQRNRNMAGRLRVRLKEGNAFIAVGALHLPGDQGLLRLLSDAGYRVTRVY